MHKEMRTSLEMIKLDNLNTIHSIKSVSENVKQLSRRMDENAGAHASQAPRRRTREVDELRVEIESLKRQQELRENKIKRSPKIGSIREFCAKTESEYMSSGSGKKFRGKNFLEVQPAHVREFRLDSSISQVMRPFDLFKDAAVKVQWDSDNSSIKTSNNKNIMAVPVPDFKHFLEDDFNDDNYKKTPLKANQMANVKDFDDFKFLLKDLKMTLNMSDFSTFQDNLNEQMGDLEKVLTDYSDLDKKIVSLVESKNYKLKLNNSFYDNGAGAFLDVKKSQSVLLNGDSGDKYIKELEILKADSNINHYHIKIKDLKNNPFDFDSFIFRVKKEFNQRKKKFDEIQEFVV